MAFSSHPQNGLVIYPPDDYNFNYDSSPESYSPYTPVFPSHPTLDPSFQTEHLTDSHYLWAPPIDAYDRYEYSPDPKPGELLLHAPTPLHGQSSLLFPDTLTFTPPAIKNQSSLYIENTVTGSPQFGAYTPHSTRSSQPTFPTPSEMLDKHSGNIQDGNASQEKSETRQRVVTKDLGSLITDLHAATPPHVPESSLIVTHGDTITSHEKKRHYLECLEYYVMYLHQQLHLVGVRPFTLERVSNYRGMNNRSIRTLLVHMENINRKLNLQMATEEHRFINLRDQVSKLDASQHHHLCHMDSRNYIGRQ